MGKKIVFLLIVITLIVMIAGWFGLQYFIDEHDIDRNTSSAPNEIIWHSDHVI
ncbi:hypothetical protein GCM10028778_13400 [Barrientosiimonas marina]|uniref:Uncharacterized protein n=1 Tax=Lentibacillus kimchii TaxID=1542911 RepID=A0ABW2UR25_9BACI